MSPEQKPTGDSFAKNVLSLTIKKSLYKEEEKLTYFAPSAKRLTESLLIPQDQFLFSKEDLGCPASLPSPT